VALLFLAPFAWLVSMSLKPENQVFATTINWIPHPVMWSNYARAVSEFPFARYFINTMTICVFVVIGATASSSFVAYGFARVRWPGREVLFVVVLGTLILPYQVVMIPQFLLFRGLGWVNTYLPMIVPAFFGNAFFMFLLRQFFLTIPTELGEAVRVDGGSEFTIFSRIVIPLSTPALAVVALFTFINSWNDFLGPLVYLRTQAKYTLAIGLSTFLGQYGSQWSWLMAASTLVFIPIVILFFFTQRTFIQGITFTGSKG
jgi:multiple sugar transport system permease protein